MDIIKEIKKFNLIGRGGACYPVAAKWEAVAQALRNNTEEMTAGYVVCNVSEGEPGVKKDGYILEKYPERVIEGMKLAMDYLFQTKTGIEVRGYIYINHEYQKKLGKRIAEAIKAVGANIEIFVKPMNAGYIGGEETSLLNTMEGRRTEPRLRPPYPTVSGLRHHPTLINNVETFLNVSRVARGDFENTRFYTLGGDILGNGVFELSDSLTIAEVLKKTNNHPNFSFFVQVGGDGSGVVLTEKQLNIPASGAGSITVYSMLKHQPMDVIKRWLDFFMAESCGQCVPCREGVYRLREMVNVPIEKINWQLFADLLANLSDAAFCGLGCAVPIPIESYIKNVLADTADNKIKLPRESRQMICQCFS